MGRFAIWWANIVFKRAGLVLLAAIFVTILAIRSIGNLGVSTQIEALMPQGTKSVQTLNAALRKTGSFASIQIVATSNSPETTLAYIQAAKVEMDRHDWVQSSQYSEDISVLEQHKLLLLDLEELQELERDINIAYPTIIAQRISEAFGGNDVSVVLRAENLSGTSTNVLDTKRLEDIQSNVSNAPQTERAFLSEDGLTAVLVVWPRSGLDSLSEAKRMVDDSTKVVEGLNTSAAFIDDKIASGVAGRIANKVAQFDAIMNDLKVGLITAIIMIAALISWSYRSLMVLPLILIPLTLGIVWTLGMTALTIGGLNLITVFLALILFGLGIDFGIHNFSRYREERRDFHGSRSALTTVIRETGGASLIAALTTASAFFTLTLTEFRAFTEFGFIAGMGILLTFAAMYSVMPALLVVCERLGWRADKIKSSKVPKLKSNGLFSALYYRKSALFGIAVLFLFSLIFAPQIAFERNIKNLEANQPMRLILATKAVARVFSDGHDRAIIVVETLDELLALNHYFKSFIKDDVDTPTIKKVSSLLDFVPDQASQKERLEVIKRLDRRADELQGLDPSRYAASKPYLSIENLNVADLPPALRRTYLGTQSEPGYLMYVYNSVSMDDSRTARLFYDDAAKISISGKDYYSASEGFIFVEMIALMKADAIKAISLVTLTTAIFVFVFVRSLKGTLVVLLPPLLGVLLTVAIMGAFGPNLSIMNMVILPSLIGIAVDNSIHIFHRFELEGARADISKIMNTTGRAAVLTTLTTLIGFGGMVTASMGGLRSMGALAIIGFLSCLLMTWVLLPILLQIYQYLITGKEKYHGKN